jgi:MFS family permease
MTFREVLAIPPLRRLFYGQLVSVLGDFLAIFAVIVVATFRLKANAAEIALLLVAFMAPMAIVSPLAGVLVDRWDRKRTMIVSDLIRAVLVVGLVYTDKLWHIYVIFALLSCVSAFFMPAQSVLVRSLVPAAGLMSANALLSQIFQVVQIVSPALSGWLVDHIGAELCFWFDSASFLVSAACIAGVTPPPSAAPQPAVGSKAAAVWHDLAAGMRFLLSRPALRFVVISMAVAMFSVRCFGALLAVYARDVLSTSGSTFGVLNSLIGVGMIAATQTVHRLGARRERKDLVIAGLLGAGVAIAFLAAIPSIAAASAGLFGLGFGVAFVFVPAQTLLQESTPLDMLGRVSSSMMSMLAFAQVIALLGSGAAAEAIGIANLYYASAALLVLHALLSRYRLTSARASSPSE